MRVSLSALMLVSITFGCERHRSPEEVITVGYVERIVATLSADEMAGRQPFTPGIERAAGFIAREFAGAGLEVMTGLEGYVQEFPTFNVSTETHRVLLNDREIPADRCFFVVNERSASWSTGDSLELVVIGPDDDAREVSSSVRGQSGDRLILMHERHRSYFNRLRSYMGGARFTTELGGGGSSIYVLTNAAAVRSYDIEVTNHIEQRTLANVVGVVPGRRRNEIVVFGAHYDHIGIRPPVDGDSIANGANDDATGTAAVVALAEFFGSRPRPERTLVFVAFTAEEMGGQGSRYMAQQLDPEHVVAMVNFEMIGKPERERPASAWITGFDRSTLGEILQSAVDTNDFSFHPDPQPEQNLFMRSDNAPFARLGVPAHSIGTGLLADDEDYHRMSDEIETLDLAHLARTIVAVAKAVMPLVSGNATPTRIDPASLN